MSLTAKLHSAVDKAFAAVGDLVKTATLVDKTAISYDFSTSTAKVASSNKTVSVILNTTNKGSGEAVRTSIIMKSGVDLSVYDTIKIDNVSYTISDHSDNGFVIEANVVKEN